MTLAVARDLAALVGEARDAFVAPAEAALEAYHQEVASLLALNAPDLRGRLEASAERLLLTLAGLWALHLGELLKRSHTRLNLPPPEPYSGEEARAIMRPGAVALLAAALMTFRTNRATSERLGAAWDRQFAVGGAFTALRGSMRGATAGTFNTLANASVIDTVRARAGPGWILGAYNPLDERTADLDWRLCLNTGQAIRTNRGRVVVSLPGLVGKYTLENAWVPGPPRIGGDTHEGCRCWLVPERRS